MIESLDQIALPLYAILLYAAAMYPIGAMLGSSCSSCCGCQTCTGCDCCDTEYSRPTGFCCEGEWRTSGSCCGGVYRTTESGQCCDDKWYTGSGTCCEVPTVQLSFSSTFGGVEACDSLASGKIILTDGKTVIDAVLRKGGSGYARVVDDEVEVAVVTVTTLGTDDGTPPTISVTIDEDPDSETFGQIIGLTIDSPGGGYDQWMTQLQEHWFPSSEEGECCGNDWRTDEGDCCNGVWYPDEEPCPEGQVYVRLSEQCCGCWPDEIYDPEAEELVPTADNTDLLSCSSCGFQSQLYSRYSDEGIDEGELGRCCAGDGACTYTFESDCDGTWEELCCDDLPKCTGPCCKEDDDGVVTCEIVANDDCTTPDVIGGEADCESSCKGACCIDGSSIGLLTQAECDEADGCWAGIGEESCRPTDECRPPFSTNCCESTVSDASGLTFTQPRRKRCDGSNTAWLVTVTGTTDSEILVHGTPVGETATPTKRCPINVSFQVCWDKFNIEPMPCESEFRRLDVTVCWEPVENASEIVNYSGCNDISLWLSDCTRGNCKTTLAYDGPGVTSTIDVDVRGDAEIQANGSGALVFSNDFDYAANGCDRTLTLSGTSTAANTMSTIKQQIPTLTSLVKDGSGLWVLSQNNLHGGTNEIKHGTILVGINTLPSSGAFGTLSAAVMMSGTNGPVALLLANTVTFTKWVLVTAEGGAATIGGADAGTSAFNDPNSYIFAGRPLTLQAATGGTIEFRNRWNNVTGDDYPSVDITIGSAGNTGTVELTEDLSTTGSVIVAFGTLHVTGASGQFQFAEEVVVSGAAAELRYDSDIDMARPLSLTAGTLSGDATINTVAVSGSPAVFVDSGDELVIDVELSGTGTLAKTGAGTLRLTSANTFTGTLNVSAGTVVTETIPTNPGGLATSATFTNTTLSVAFTADPTTGAQYVLLAGPTTQAYTPVLTGTTATGTYDAATATLTIT